MNELQLPRERFSATEARREINSHWKSLEFCYRKGSDLVKRVANKARIILLIIYLGLC